MLDQDFCDFLEYEMCRAFKNSSIVEVKGFWCDGVLLCEPDNLYSKTIVNRSREVKLKAFIGKDGQTEYELTLKFGDIALSRFVRDLDIKECISNSIKDNLFSIDTLNNKIEMLLD